MYCIVLYCIVLQLTSYVSKSIAPRLVQYVN